MYKVKNAVLISISFLMGVIWVFSVSLIDSFSFLPFAGFIVSSIWLSLFAMANGWMDLEYYEKGEDEDVHS